MRNLKKLVGKSRKEHIQFLKDFGFSLGFILTYLSIFIYGMIWLDKTYSVDHMLMKSELRQEQYVEERMKEIMPSAFKGNPTNAPAVGIRKRE